MMGSDACFGAVFRVKTRIFYETGNKGARERGVSDAEGDAGAGEVGVGADGSVVQAGAVASAAAGGLVAGDAAGGGDSGGRDCREDGIHGEDGVPDGAGGTEAEHHARSAGKDGAGGGVRSGVRAGSVGTVARGSCYGIGGAGGVEKAIYDAASRQVGELAGRMPTRD